MKKKSTRSEAKRVKRFSVTLDVGDYERLKSLADGHRPRLSLQYVVRYAIRRFLDGIEDPQLMFEIGNPLRGRSTDG